MQTSYDPTCGFGGQVSGGSKPIERVIGVAYGAARVHVIHDALNLAIVA